MKLIMIRHAEPNYEIDGLTDNGEVEAKYLARRLCAEDIDSFYCSPLGRAKKTAEPTLRCLGKEAEYCEWLREFDYCKVKLPYLDRDKCCWDILPEFVDERPQLYSPEKWREVDFIKASSVPDEYDKVCCEFDKVLEAHGYKRDGANYKVTNSNRKTLVFICHFGLMAVLISHIMNCSPYSVWQNTVALPSSVTIFNSEERRPGRALFRASCFGDTSHLYKAGITPSFAARFCECFSDGTRH